jgi:penicillin-binding protein 1C
VGLAVLTAGVFLALWWVPFPGATLDQVPEGRRVLARDGRVLRDTLAPGDLRARPLAPGEFGDWAEKAIIAAEDKRFFTHPGIDLLALLRAVGQNVGSMRVVSGASTLSTQVIRLMEPRSRTVGTKLIEAFRALQMETHRNKDDILAQYLNRAPFGGNRAGLEAASLAYFGKRAQHLTLGEASLLAGLPQSPSRFRPDRHLERALKRREFVLDRMEVLGFVSQDQRKEAEAQTLSLRQAPSPFEAPHWCDEALRTSPATTIHTTLDPKLQSIATETLASASAGLEAKGVHGGSVVIVDVKASALRAMVGSPDYQNARHQGQVNGAIAPRSAGSTLKPFLYAQAIDRGVLTPATMLADVPRTYVGYRPQNATRTFHGLVRANEALVLSLNMPALQLTSQVGLDSFHRLLQKLGLSTLGGDAARYGISLALGTADVRLTELANAYACLARGGIWKPLRREETSVETSGTKLFSEQAAWLVAEMLGGEERAMSFFGSLSDSRLPRVAWKTGTSNGLRDAWTVSWNPEFVVAVWLGNPDGSGAEALKGIENAAPIAGQIWRRLYEKNPAPWYIQPQGLGEYTACAATGRPCGPACPRATSPAMNVPGISDPTPCAVHRRIDGTVSEFWPAEVADWLAVNGTARSQPRSSGWRIVTPREGETYRRLDLPGGRGKTLSFASEGTSQPLHWFLNGQPVEPEEWTLQPGRHTLACSDGTGRMQTVKFRVE